MRKFYYLPLALAALAMGSCSSDDATAEGGNGHDFNKGGYLKMAINLPSRTSNGAFKANDNFDDGLASEYAVNNAVLMLFKGADEANATFHSAYNLPTNTTTESPANNQVTATMRIVERTNNSTKPGENEKLYAFVIVNNNGLVTVNETNNKASINGSDFTGKISDLQAMTIEGGVSKFSTTGLLMTNAPLSTVAGGGDTAPADYAVQTLADVSSAIYSTEAEALAKPATDIYVERAVAKVTLTSNVNKLSGEDAGIKNKPITVTGWSLTNTNTKSYLVRNTKTADAYLPYKSDYVTTGGYRFIGASPVKTGVSLYRTYWAQDPNYSSFVANDLANPTDPSSYTFASTGDENPLYCMENTFDVANQKKQSTTQAVIRTAIGTADNQGHYSTFYAINDDRTQMYDADGRDAAVKKAILANADVLAWVKANGNGATVGASNVAVTYGTKVAATGVLPVTAFTVTIDANKKYEASSTSHADALTAVNSAAVVYEYTDGVAYYPALIKHFGDDLTPWNTTAHPASVGDVYENNSEQKFLGRYGVLRNNWYSLNVTGIKALGSPVVPDVTTNTDTDDDLYNYISVSVNILSWAKRSQNVEL